MKPTQRIDKSMQNNTKHFNPLVAVILIMLLFAAAFLAVVYWEENLERLPEIPYYDPDNEYVEPASYELTPEEKLCKETGKCGKG